MKKEGLSALAPFPSERRCSHPTRESGIVSTTSSRNGEKERSKLVDGYSLWESNFILIILIDIQKND